MSGLEYIAKVFNKPYKDIAEELQVSKQLVNDWIKGRSEVPKKHLPKLSKMFNGIDERFFRQKLSRVDEIKIEIAYQQMLNDEEHSMFFKERERHILLFKMESLLHVEGEEISKRNLELLKKFVGVLEGEVKVKDGLTNKEKAGLQKKVISLDMFLHMLSDYGNISGIDPIEKRGGQLFKDLLNVLKKHDVISEKSNLLND